MKLHKVVCLDRFVFYYVCRENLERLFIMNITPINVVNFSGSKTDKVKDLEQEKDTKLVSKPEEESSIDKKKVGGLVLATALAAATLGGAVVNHRWKSAEKAIRMSEEAIRNSMKKGYEADIARLRNNYSELLDSAPYQENRSLKQQIENVNSVNEKLKEVNQKLRQNVQETKDRLADIFEGDLTPKQVREETLERAKKAINEGDYGYDITNPPVTGKGGHVVSENAIPMPTQVGTANRAGMIDLNIPEISADGRFSFELPTSSEMKISNMPSQDFKPQKCQTSISESYADSVQWNNDKIARDIMQNFYDGHGQTLDGVKLNFVPTANGKYRVRIEGKSTYTPDKAVYIGESTKRNNAKAAGNYGEGLKMSVLKLLKDSGAEDVKIASDNWQLVYKLEEGNLSDKRVLAYSLDKVDKYNGNFMEFEISDKGLLESLRNSITRFYHSNNPDFKCPDFENHVLGVKLLPNGQKGGIYIAGQRFEYDGSFDGLNGVSLFLKEKPPLGVLDISRDRVSLNKSNLGEIAQWIGKSNEMSVTEKANLLKALEPYWDKVSWNSETPMHEFVADLIRGTQRYDVDKKLAIKFPEKYVAYSPATDDVVLGLRRNGYTVCQDKFADIGMQTIKDLLGDARAHDVVIPNEIQKKKILILKEALRKLAPSLEGEHFAPEELNSKIYMFDRLSGRDSRLHSDALAEAIVDNGVSKGFWIDKNYLDTANFSEVLETALHELSHKVGGDESAEFSYKLTNVNKKAIGQLLDDAQARNEIQALASIWNSL